MKKSISENRKLVEFFKKNYKKKEVISAVFEFFKFDCLEKGLIDSNKLDDLIKQFNQNNGFDCSILEEILNTLRISKETILSKEDALIKEVVSYIESNLAEEITIEEISKKLNVSYYYLCHIFKLKYNVSINDYRNKKRLEKALHLLTSTKSKISEIAILCGFNSASYFSEIFKKNLGVSPTYFKNKNGGKFFHKFYKFEDFLLADKIDFLSFMGEINEKTGVVKTLVNAPTDQFEFLHEAAIIEYHGCLFASWYCNNKTELQGYTPIFESRSKDGGKTWSKPQKVVGDESKKILYCPPVYAIYNDTLYMFVNEMILGDYMHALDLFKLNNETEKFEFVWSKPIPFKVNTNAVKLPNGKLMLPGRIAEMDSFPNTPAVLICDSGNPEAEWRLVKITNDGELPDGNKFIHPEITAIIAQNKVYMFCRNDQRRVPIVFVSEDCAEHWSRLNSCDIPFNNSKIYGGTLLDGRHYLVCNIDKFVRERLVLYLTENEKLEFTKKIVLFDRYKEPIENEKNIIHCHYPSVCEADDKLHIITTAQYAFEDGTHKRGAYLFTVDLDTI